MVIGYNTKLYIVSHIYIDTIAQPIHNVCVTYIKPIPNFFF